MQTVRYVYRVNTPMFLGGANQQPELRVTSLKGALRFWWRTLQWQTLGNDVETLQRNEAELFGSSDQKIGRSKISLRIAESDLKSVPAGDVLWADETRNSRNGNERRGGACYLGYGAVNAFASRRSNLLAGQLTRGCLMPGHFTLQVTLDRRLDENQRQGVHDSLQLLGTIGGLGTGSRRGFGSVTLCDVQHRNEGRWRRSKDWTPIDVRESLQRLLAASTSPMPEWTAWSEHSRVVLVQSSGSERDLLDAMGREFVQYRGWGHDNGGGHTVLGRASEYNFPGDHDLSKGKSKGLPKGFEHPLRVAFGLPHNYGPKKSDQVAPADSSNERKLDRRASPLFFHVHQTSDKASPVGVIASLPARFLPDTPKPPRLRTFGDVVPLNTTTDFWKPINGFLNRLSGQPDTSDPILSSEPSTDLVGEEIQRLAPEASR